MSSELGIDKLQFLLSVNDVKFTPDFQALLHHQTAASTGEVLGEHVLYVADGKEFRGRKAVLNTDNLNLTISPHREGGDSVFIVHCSAGAYSENNLQPLDLEGCFRVAHNARAELSALGAQVDLERAKLTRIDIARNVELNHPVACYSPVFAALSCRKKVDKKDFGGTGFLVGNKSWEIGFYDKGAEMLEKGHPPGDCPENTLRPELRLKKSALIRNAISCDTLQQLPESWSKLRDAYSHHLKRDVFKAKEEAVIDRTLNWYDMAAYIAKSPSKSKWQAFKSQSGLLQLVQEMGLEMAICFAAEHFHLDGDTETRRKQIYRITQDLKQASFALQSARISTSGMKVKELHREMKRAVMDF